MQAGGEPVGQPAPSLDLAQHQKAPVRRYGAAVKYPCREPVTDRVAEG